MADETCISVYIEDQDQVVDFCWEETEVQPLFEPDNVKMGLRQSTTDGARAWRTCHYFLAGMPAICAYWGTAGTGAFSCHYVSNNTEEGQPAPADPTGYNQGNCDFLGRRIWCDKYTAHEDDPGATRVCIAPNPYLSGLGKKAETGDGIVLRPVHRDEIYGYNITDDGFGIGQCDCYGMGRGEPGCALIGDLTPPEEGEEVTGRQKERALSSLGVVCNYYRPYQMGFGAVKPQVVPLNAQQRARIDYIEAEPYLQDIRDNIHLDERLPLNFHVYGLRARFQTCLWYSRSGGSTFTISEGTIMFSEELQGDSAFDDDGKLIYCGCPESSADPFRILAEGEAAFTAGLMASEVICQDGSVVCNGAKPECPCYSGKWVFCVDDKMLGGMAITAEQIMELRFWSADWENQDQYTRFFRQFPNRSDPASSAIFTFDKWRHDEGITDHWDSRLLGKSVDLCVPVPYHYRDFGLDAVRAGVLLKEDITYAAPYVDLGTNTDDQRSFPSLVRWPEFMDTPPLEIIYPYRSNDPFGAEFCAEDDSGLYDKIYYDLSGGTVSVIGYTARDKKVYVINHFNIPSFLHDYYGVYEMPLPVRIEAYEAIRNYVFDHINDEYAKTGSSDSTGAFVIEDIKIDYGHVHLTVFVDLGDGTWEYRKRPFFFSWAGGIIDQISFTKVYPTGASAPQHAGYSTPNALRFDPEAEAQLQVVPAGVNSNAEMFSAYTREIPSVDGTSYTVYDYHIRKTTPDTVLTVSKWVSVGNSNKIVAELDVSKLNYIYDWDILTAKLVPLTEVDPETGGERTIRPNAATVELETISITRSSIEPDMCVFRPVNDDVRIRFLPSEWRLDVTYYYTEFTNDNPENNTGEQEVIFGAGQSDLHRYSAAPYSFDPTRSAYSVFVNFSTGPVGVFADFKDSNGRTQSTSATKALGLINSIRCRNVDIYYRYSSTAKDYALVPRSGFCINPDNDQALGTTSEIWEIPRCADHEYSDLNFRGPVWYPYDACQEFNLYNEFTGANFCTASYVGPDVDNADANNRDVPVIGVGVYTSSLAGAQNLVYRRDYRYCGPHNYDTPMLEARGTLRACSCGWDFLYSDARDSSVIFRGRVKRRGPVDEAYYQARDWDLPPFGNEGCNLVEKFITQDYTTHFVKYGPYLRSEWMPMVMDHSTFYFGFNAFAAQDFAVDYALGDHTGNAGIVFTNQMSFKTLANIGETVQENIRYRFDEIFDVRYEGNCSYPPPTIYRANNVTTNTFYTFKQEDIVWAWQEYWQPIERNTGFLEGEKLNFFDVEYIPYVFDLYKNEHRMIPEEGQVKVRFTWPETGLLGDHASSGDYGTIFLEGGPFRFFELMYGDYGEDGIWRHTADNYNDEQVVWRDEGGGTHEGGSSGENPYEQASTTDDWFHVAQGYEDRILFDSEYAETTQAAAAAGREMVVEHDELQGGDIKKYYNRGLLFNIKKSDLDYLPKKIRTGYLVFPFTEPGGAVPADRAFGFEGFDDEYSEYLECSEDMSEPAMRNILDAPYVWGPTGDIMSLTTLRNIVNVNLLTNTKSITINGVYGVTVDPRSEEKIKVYKPGINYTLKTFNFPHNDLTSVSPRGWPVGVVDPLDPDTVGITDLRRYQIHIELPLGPVELIRHPEKDYIIDFYWSEGGYIAIDSIQIEHAEKNSSLEVMNVWERKYIASKASSAPDPNTDGPQDLLRYQQDLHNSGQYFRFKGRSFRPESPIQTQNKLRGVFTGAYYPDDEDIQVSYDSLFQVEREEQQRDYLEALSYDDQGDTYTYVFELPRALYGQLNFWSFPFSWAGSLMMRSDKLPWEYLSLYKRFRQYAFWRPGGHKYTWDDRVRIEKCTLFGPRETVHDARYQHMDHTGIGNPLTDASTAVDPVNSYYSLRFYTQVAKYDRFLIISGGVEPAGGGDLVSSANLYNPGPDFF